MTLFFLLVYFILYVCNIFAMRNNEKIIFFAFDLLYYIRPFERWKLIFKENKLCHILFHVHTYS